MPTPEEFRKERARLLARIEANRTPEARIVAKQFREQRAYWDALPNGRKTEIEEMDVFTAFAAAAPEARVESGSGTNAVSPEPDIRCTVSGERHYFELGEIIDPPVAESMAHAIRRNEPRPCAFSQDRPFSYITAKKRSRPYRTSGAPVELLLYYRTQSPPEPLVFDKLVNNAALDLQALVTSGPFQRVWIFDFSQKRVLWHS